MRDQMDLFVRKFLGRVKLVKSNEASRVGGSVDGHRIRLVTWLHMQ